MSTTVAAVPKTKNPPSASLVRRGAWHLIGVGGVITIATIVALIFISPLIYMVLTSLKSDAQMTNSGVDALPMSPVLFAYKGQNLQVYKVPTDKGLRELALLQSNRRESVFIDPANADGEQITVPVRVATLEKVMRLDPHPEIYAIASDEGHMNFPRALINTLAITLISSIGALTSASLVAYGFSRFRIPGSNILFLVLMSTIILPPQVTLIPLYILFSQIGWIGTILPLVVPHFFSNAYNVFLLRQYFMTIPNEMDEAAKVDGANPLQTFWYVILPQARAALLTVTIFHFVVIWGEYYNALIFTSGNRDAQPLSVALGRFQQLFTFQPNQMMAAAVLTMLIPLIIFFLAQRQFMQGIVSTGVEK